MLALHHLVVSSREQAVPSRKCCFLRGAYVELSFLCAAVLQSLSPSYTADSVAELCALDNGMPPAAASSEHALYHGF